jgi:hypothetical protein
LATEMEEKERRVDKRWKRTLLKLFDTIATRIDKYEMLANDHKHDACSDAGKMLAECRKVKEAAKKYSAEKTS